MGLNAVLWYCLHNVKEVKSVADEKDDFDGKW